MTIEEVWPVPGIPRRRARLIQRSERLGSGGFSVVLKLSAHRVLKLTCCEATQRLFDTLMGQSAPRLARRHLPRVFANWGVCATDNDGILYRGYVLERLFTARELANMPALPLNAANAETRNLSEQLLDRLRTEKAALGDARRLYTHQDAFGWEDAVEIAEMVLEAQTAETAGAFVFLRDFCRRNKAALDLEIAGNILFGRNMRLVLADPVTAPISTGLDEVHRIRNDECSSEPRRLRARHRNDPSGRPNV